MLFFSRWVLVTVCLLVAGVAHAAGTIVPIAVAPIRVQLDPDTNFSAVEVSNRGNTSTGVEVEMMKVHWQDNFEVYEKTSDFVVSPPAFRLAAGKARMIRFHYSGQRSNMEGFYRLYIRQLPEATSGNQINLVVNIGVPVFIAPVTTRAQLAISRIAKSKMDTRLVSELRNTGNVTLTLMQLEGDRCVGSLQKLQIRLAPLQKFMLDKDWSHCATSVQTDMGQIALATP